jgi:hypothetical protein
MSGALNFAIENKDSIAPVAAKRQSPSYIVPRETVPLTLFRLGVCTFRALFHVKNVREILAFLARVPVLSEMVQRNPRFAFKFLTGEYLARGLSVSECAACFLHHYTRLKELLPTHLLRQILEEEVTLHTFDEQGGRFALTLGLSRPYDNEGELSLRLRADGDIVFVIAFTIVPGSVLSSQAPEVLLITRLQGIKGRYPQISQATRALHDIAPARLLFAALQGIAEAFGIQVISAIPAERQTSYKKDADLAFKTSYDVLFAELGLLPDEAGGFSSPLPLAHKPLASIKRPHRHRARKKRAFSRQVQSACAGFFQSHNSMRARDWSQAQSTARVIAWPTAS